MMKTRLCRYTCIELESLLGIRTTSVMYAGDRRLMTTLNFAMLGGAHPLIPYLETYASRYLR